MGLFFDVLTAINNPDQKASVGQLSDVTSTIQQIAGNSGLEPSTMQTVLSSLGSALRPALRQQASTGDLGSLMGQLGGLGAGASGLGSLSSLLTPQLQQQIVQAVKQKTGVSAGTIQGMLPALIPVVMQVLNMGASTSSEAAPNLLLRSFLDSDRDQDVDFGDVFKFATRFLNLPR